MSEIAIIDKSVCFWYPLPSLNKIVFCQGVNVTVPKKLYIE